MLDKTDDVMSEIGANKFKQLKQEPGSADGNYCSVNRISFLSVREMSLFSLRRSPVALVEVVNSE